MGSSMDMGANPKDGTSTQARIQRLIPSTHVLGLGGHHYSIKRVMKEDTDSPSPRK